MADSTATGRVKARALGHVTSTLLDRRTPHNGLRITPVVAPDGSRRVYAMVRTSKREWGSGGRPVELTWK